MADPDTAGLGGHGGQHHFGRRAVGVLLQEMMFDAPDPVEAQLVGETGLLEGVPVHRPLRLRAEGPGRRQLEEYAKAHRACVAPRRARRGLSSGRLGIWNNAAVGDLSLWSERSYLSIASRGSVLSIGSVGSVLSIGSVGSTLSVGSVGSFLSAFSGGSALSLGSGLSVASRWSILTAGGDRPDATPGRMRPVPWAGAGLALLAAGLFGLERRRRS